MPVAPKQDAKIIEPTHNALQLDPVDKKNRQRSFVLANVVEKRVLQVLSFFSRHGCFPFFSRRLLDALGAVTSESDRSGQAAISTDIGGMTIEVVQSTGVAAAHNAATFALLYPAGYNSGTPLHDGNFGNLMKS
jgi:hypothetical protein